MTCPKCNRDLVPWGALIGVDLAVCVHCDEPTVTEGKPRTHPNNCEKCGKQVGFDVVADMGAVQLKKCKGCGHQQLRPPDHKRGRDAAGNECNETSGEIRC